MTVPEVEDLRLKVLRQIERHPEAHDQEVWESECGTTRCVAGWALILAYPQATSAGQALYFYSEDHYVAGGGSASFEEAAGRLLGLTPFEASDLFFGISNEEAVEKLRDLVHGGGE